MIIRLRTNKFGSKRIKLCEHVAIKGCKTKEKDEDCEYIETLYIYCAFCKGNHIIESLIN